MRMSVKWCLLLIQAVLLLTALPARAEDLPPVALPAPQMDGGKPLMQALHDRKSQRDFAPTPLAPQVLADLLWAGDGINRPEIAHRTAPSAMNAQEIDIYVATADGVYVYDAKGNRLQPVAAGDIRPRTGSQAFVKVAPVALLYVADGARQTKAKPEDKDRYAALAAGFIVQNVYLYCASAGLAAVVHETPRDELREALHLKPEQKILIAQSVGYLKVPATAPAATK